MQESIAFLMNITIHAQLRSSPMLSTFNVGLMAENSVTENPFAQYIYTLSSSLCQWNYKNI